MSNLNYIIMKNLKLFIAAFALVFAVQVSANTDKPVKATAQLQSELVNLMGSEVPFQIENGELTRFNPPTRDRVKLWISTGVHVVGNPNNIFVKLHTHGTQEDTMKMFFDQKGLENIFSYFDEYKDLASVYYVSSREMTNIIKATEDGVTDYSETLRDYRYQILNK